jgi:dihydrofolate synthase/folylpolyglutamate synthase
LSSRFHDYAGALEWLAEHVDFERVNLNRSATPTLEHVRAALAMMADPQTDYPCVHLTGTNGKGTTTTLTSALLANTGLRVGTFTSPDLHAVNERIAINGEPIDDATLAQLLGRLYDLESVTSIVLTRFELLTVAALLHFSDEGVDVAVIEVGLGGTWDSTNVIDGVVNVLTNVDLDHTQVLGDTVSAIARDKVGIFRPDATALVATTNAVVVEIAQARASELGTTLWLVGESFDLVSNELALGGRLLTVRTPYATYEDVLLTLHGLHQGVNAATALAAAEAFLGRAIGEDVVRATFGDASMPGRMEILSSAPMIVVDGAHNPAGIRALAATLDGAFHVLGTRRCVLGMLEGRDLDDMVEPLVALGFNDFHCCAPASPRAVPAAQVAAAVRRHGGVAHEHPSSQAALAHARELSSDDDLIVVAGSLYLVAEARADLLQLPRHR